MKRRDFCKLVTAGAAGMWINGLPWAPQAAADADAWSKWFCDHAPPQPPTFAMTDAHFHFYNFIAHTDGAQALIRAMNANKVEHIMFSGMPLVKKWDRHDHRAPVYYLDNNSRAYWYSATDLLIARTVQYKIPAKDRYRFHPFICGVNGTDLYAVEHVQRMLDEYGDLWHGVGELFAHRDDLTNLTFGETARADHPAMMRIYQLAARHDLPVVVHNNVSSRGLPAELLYWPEVENAATRNPQTRFVWAHAGLSRYFGGIDQAKYTAKLGALLQKSPNLHIDLSWLAFESYVAPDPSQGPLKCWLDLISSFPERFMIGSDSIGEFSYGKLNCRGGARNPSGMKYAFNMRKYWVLLAALSPEQARMVGRDNFLKLLPGRVRKSLV